MINLLSSKAAALDGFAVWQQNAQTNLANRKAAELIRLYRNEGLTNEAIAERLNQMGYRARRGQAFLAMSVKRLDQKACVRINQID